jgi:nucleoid-associated protein YgaU
MPKYLNEQNGVINVPLYEEKIKERGQKKIIVKRTINFGKVKDEEIGILDEVIWSYGNSLHKLAVKYYGDANYYWVIGLVNNKPTDSHYKLGDTVIIPAEPKYIDSLIGERNVNY